MVKFILWLLFIVALVLGIVIGLGLLRRKKNQQEFDENLSATLNKMIEKYGSYGAYAAKATSIFGICIVVVVGLLLLALLLV